MNKIKIAIDGPAGSGKTTTAKLVAEKLGYVYIDTGAMYRAVTLAWIRSGEEMTDENMLKLLDSIEIDLRNTDEGQKTLLNAEDVSYDIRLPQVTTEVSPVSAMACVRERLVSMQRKMGEAGAVVMDGRDIGTEVFPGAELKIYLVASVEARAMRRTKEMIAKGMEANEEDIKKDIMRRDNYDSSREHSPLRKAEDAIEIDTSDISIEQQTDMILNMARELIGSGE